MKKMIIIAGALMVLVACNSKKDAKKENKAGSNRNKPLKVEAYIARLSTVSEKIEVPGSILPYESTELHPEISGRVVGLYIKEGSYVQKGALLAKLFDGDLQAQIKKLQAQQGIAETTADRYSQLIKIGGISQQEYDLSKLEIGNIQADIAVLRAGITKTEIRAPFSGKIGLRSISTGAYVTPATIVASIQQVAQLKLEFTVPEIYTAKISNGMPIRFTIDGYDGVLTARVIATEAAIATTNRSLRIRAVVSATNNQLVPGGFAKVTVDLGDNKNALLVPSQAVMPQARTKQIILYKGGIAKFIEVNTNVRDSAMVEIISGLKAGDTVITTGLLAIKPDAKIQIANISNDSVSK